MAHEIYLAPAEVDPHDIAITGEVAPPSDGALLEFGLPCCVPPITTTLLALVVRDTATSYPVGWTKVIDGEGTSGIFLDGYARRVDGEEDATLALLSLVEQELTGALLPLNNVDVATMIESVEHAEFTAVEELPAPVSTSLQKQNTALGVWVTTSAVTLDAPEGLEIADTYSSAEAATRSVLFAQRNAGAIGAIDLGSATADAPATGRAFTVVLRYDPALVGVELDLFNFGKGSLPSWVPASDPVLMAAAKTVARAHDYSHCLFRQARIGTACGPTTAQPVDWLHQHARDRGTGRQAGEDDATLRERLRQYPDAITRAAILAAVDAVLEANGITEGAAMLELPRDAAYLGEFVAMSGTGGTFVQVGTTSKFTPDVVPWPTPPYRSASVFPEIIHHLVISGAADAGNDGDREITGLEENAALVTNAAGVAGADATVTWAAQRYDIDSNLRDGFPRAFLGRGYRMTSTRPQTILLILPFGSTAGIEASVREMLRTKKAAGFRVIVERRLIA